MGWGPVGGESASPARKGGGNCHNQRNVILTHPPPLRAGFGARHGDSTVSAITIGALRSLPFTSSIVFTTASGRFGSTLR